MRGKMFVWIGAASLVVFFATCVFREPKTTGVFEEKILAVIQKCPATRPCRLKISEATVFDWDRGYALYHGSREERSSLLGTDDIGYREDQRQLVFLKNGTIVFQETEPTDRESAVKNQVTFDCPEVNGVVHADFYPETEFEVTEKRGENGRYYKLRPVPEAATR